MITSNVMCKIVFIRAIVASLADEMRGGYEPCFQINARSVLHRSLHRLFSEDINSLQTDYVVTCCDIKSIYYTYFHEKFVLDYE